MVISGVFAFKEALIISARVDGERFWHKSRFETHRHTLCISRVSNRRVGTKDPAATADKITSDSLKNGRACIYTHSKFSVFRTAATDHPPYWQNGGSHPLDLTVTDWLLVPANAKPVRQQGVPTISDPSPRRSQDTRSIMLQPSLAACVRRRHHDRKLSSHAASY